MRLLHHFGFACAVIFTAALCPVANAFDAAADRVDVHGGWVEQGCIPTAPTVDTGERVSITSACTGTTTYTGDWTGQEIVEAFGAFDLASGDYEGTGDATFTGTYLGDAMPAAGSLHIHDRVIEIDGKTSAFHVEGRIEGGDGAFAGSSGCVTYDGFLPGGSGHGGYSAIWFRGEPRGSTVVEQVCARPRRAEQRTAHGLRAPVTMRGGLFDTVPCLVPTDGSFDTPRPGEPTTVDVSCTGAAGFDGAWTGHGVYNATGTIDLLTGELDGAVDLTFTGTAAADDPPTVGTMRWRESFTLNHKTGAMHWVADIIAGDGAFAGSAGCVIGNSYEAAGAVGHGGYRALWFRGEPPGSRRVTRACAAVN